MDAVNAQPGGDGLEGFPERQARDLIRVALLEDLGPDGVDVTTWPTTGRGWNAVT